jgi:hypothetical protein
VLIEATYTCSFQLAQYRAFIKMQIHYVHPYTHTQCLIMNDNESFFRSVQPDARHAATYAAALEKAPLTSSYLVMPEKETLEHMLATMKSGAPSAQDEAAVRAERLAEYHALRNANRTRQLDTFKSGGDVIENRHYNASAPDARQRLTQRTQSLNSAMLGSVAMEEQIDNVRAEIDELAARRVEYMGRMSVLGNALMRTIAWYNYKIMQKDEPNVEVPRAGVIADRDVTAFIANDLLLRYAMDLSGGADDGDATRRAARDDTMKQLINDNQQSPHVTAARRSVAHTVQHCNTTRSLADQLSVATALATNAFNLFSTPAAGGGAAAHARDAPRAGARRRGRGADDTE